MSTRYTFEIRYGLVALAVAALCIGEIGCVDGHITGSDSVVPQAPAEEPTYDTDTDAPVDDGRSLYFYYGPMKQQVGESIINSVAAITGHSFGTWDSTRPDTASQAFIDAGNGEGDYYRHCRLLGGCMEHRIPLARTSFVGTAYVLELEKAIAVACSDREVFGMFPASLVPGPQTQVIDIINHQYLQAFSAKPSTRDLGLAIAYFEAHLAQPELEDVSPLESAGRGHCRAILGSNRFLSY